jgi:Tfp pilus assembly protein PilF
MNEGLIPVKKIVFVSLAFCLSTFSNFSRAEPGYIEHRSSSIGPIQKYSDDYQTYKKMLYHDPKCVSALLCLADLEQKRRNNQEALFNLEKARELGDKSPELYMIMALAYEDSQLTTNALRSYNEGINAHPRDTSLLLNRGLLNFRMGNKCAALKDFDTVISIDSTNSYAFRDRADTYQSMGEDARADTDFRRAIALSPENPFFRCARAEFLINRKNFVEAQKEIDAAYKIWPTYSQIALLQTKIGSKASPTAPTPARR